MPPVLTVSAIITCDHAGIVIPVPSQVQVLAGGGIVLVEPDLVGAPIVGCTTPPTPATKPCTTVVSTMPGSSAPNVLVAGRPVYLVTLVGITDGVPPGTIKVTVPGQIIVQA
jgi:hypothetical protein